MTRNAKIAILKAIYEGKSKISDLLPNKYEIRIDHTGGKFFRNGEPISAEEYYKWLDRQPKPIKFHVTRK